MLPSALKDIMAYEVTKCHDKRIVNQYLQYAVIPFSFKFLVAPVVDYFPVPGCHGNKHLRGWIILCFVVAGVLIVGLGLDWQSIDPNTECPDGARLLAWLICIVAAAAVGDIALDALAIVVLQGKNIAWVGIAGSIGQKVGTKGGRSFMVFVNDTLGVSPPVCMFVIGTAIVVANVIIARMPETAVKRTSTESSWETLKSSYRMFYDLICNRRACAFALCIALWHGGCSKSIPSSMDRKFRGYNKSDIVAHGVWEFVPSILSTFIVAKLISAKTKPLKKLVWAIPLFILGNAIEFSTYLFPPYQKSGKIACKDGGCESWVFPFRVGMGILSMPFERPALQLLVAQIARV